MSIEAGFERQSDTPTLPRRSAWLPQGFDRPALLVVLVGFLVLYLPTYWALAHTVWASDEQGHGPIILAVSLWLLVHKREAIFAQAAGPAVAIGASVFGFGLLLYIVGRSQAILMFQAASQLPVIVGLLLLFGGRSALRAAWFPVFFLLFMIPLPESLVASITGPLKSAVSAVAATLLHAIGYPVGRSGVILTVGQYQLLVADACAGLNSMFTLEALGLLYMNLMNYKSVARNIALALLLVPIAFVANIGRVMVLVLVTFHFGDEAGQGFVHSFAGMVLFGIALALMLLVDSILGRFYPPKRGNA